MQRKNTKGLILHSAVRGSFAMGLTDPEPDKDEEPSTKTERLSRKKKIQAKG